MKKFPAEIQTYREDYKKPFPHLAEPLPSLHPHITEKSVVVDATVMARGVVRRDGQRLEYIELRIYVDPMEDTRDDNIH